VFVVNDFSEIYYCFSEISEKVTRSLRTYASVGISIDVNALLCATGCKFLVSYSRKLCVSVLESLR